MQIGEIGFKISGIGSMSFDSKFDGFGVPCDHCGAKNASERLSGDMPPGIPGHYCVTCKKIKCKEASEYYTQQFKEETENIKFTVLFRKDSVWSADEVNRLMGRFEEGVWHDKKHPEHLILKGKHRSERSISKVLAQCFEYTVTHVTGTEELPFSPF
jgi:hypothetical protein